MKRLFLLGLFAATFISLSAQNAIHYTFEKAASVDPTEVNSDFAPMLQHLEMPGPDTRAYRDWLNQQKLEIPNFNYATPAQKQEEQSTADEPILLGGFEGNEFDFGVPNDNDMAISDDGMLVSVVNSSIFMYDASNGMELMNISLEAFSDTLGIPNRKFDPRILYDPEEDRFVIVFLRGSVDTASHIVVAFSTSGDPTASWHLYAIDGNPFSNVSWSDYPIISMSEDELFITINLIRNDSSWQAGFVESLIWAVDKSDGYGGSSLNATLYNNVTFAGKPIRNLCPIRGGSKSHGPNMYFVSNRNFAMENDTFFLVEVTGLMNDPNTTVTVKMLTASQNYGMPPNGIQPVQNQVLQTNDSRVLGGYLEGDKIHVVGNTVVSSSQRAGVFHGIIENPQSANTIDLSIIHDTAFDYGYPNISYSGRWDGDEQAIITYNHTSNDSFPGMSATFYDRWTGHSERKHIKSGSSFVNILNGFNERWGDYSGSQRKYDEPGVVWMSGYYGEFSNVNGQNLRHNSTWIASLESPGSSGVGIEPVESTSNVKLYPNPSSDRVFTDFSLEKKTYISVQVFDTQGKMIQEVYRDEAKKGANRIFISTGSLTAGTYHLVITDYNSGQQLATSKFVKAQ